MRILFISHRLTRNGATLALLQELRYLHEHCKDLEFEVFSPYDGPLRDDFKKICPTHYLSNRLRDQLYRHFWTKISGRPYLFGFKKGDFDLIYTNTVTMASIADTLKKEWGIPCILHFHEAVTSNYSALKSKSSILAHDFFIAVSELTKRNLVDYYGISPSKIEIQYPLSHCLDSYLQNNLPIDAVPSFGNKVVMGICGRYDWVKSSDLIPLIIKNFFTQHPDATCHFVYVCRFFSDQEKCNFDYDLKKLNVEDKITIVEEVDNPLPYFKRFDIFLMPSREESFSLTAQEAAIMETPVVGFEGVTGAEEWLKDKGGMFVPYMDLDKLSDALYLLYSDEALRKSKGVTSKRLVLEMFGQASKMEGVVQAIRRFDKAYQPDYQM